MCSFSLALICGFAQMQKCNFRNWKMVHIISSEDIWFCLLPLEHKIDCGFCLHHMKLKVYMHSVCLKLNLWTVVVFSINDVPYTIKWLYKTWFWQKISTRYQNISPNPNLALPPILIDRIWSGRVPVINDLLEQSTTVWKTSELFFQVGYANFQPFFDP